jgi:hypothetical protein
MLRTVTIRYLLILLVVTVSANTMTTVTQIDGISSHGGGTFPEGVFREHGGRPPKDCTNTIDQNQANDFSQIASFEQTDLAQSFQQFHDNCSGGGIYLSPGYGDSDTVTIGLWTGLPGQGGTLLAQATTVGTAGLWCDVFWEPVNVTPGMTYYLVFSGNETLVIAGDTTDPYPRGHVYANPGYDPFPAFDYAFRTYWCATPCDEIVDQYQGIVGPTAMASFDQTDLAQSFQQTGTDCSGAGIHLFPGWGTTDTVAISLWTDLPNQGGSRLAMAMSEGTQGTWCDVFWNPVEVVPGETYYLVFSGNMTLAISGSTDNPYPYGHVYANTGYEPYPGYDYTFRTYHCTDATPTPLCINHGDVDFNGVLTAGDAQMTFNIVLGTMIPTYEEECAADCDGNGTVTAADAQRIFLSVLGLVPGCEDPII